MKIFDARRYGKIAFFVTAICVVAIFLHLSSRIVKDLSRQERERMELWADATRRLADPKATDDEIDFLFKVIHGNTTIPVLVADARGNILDHRNFDLPVPDQLDADENVVYLEHCLSRLKDGPNVIIISLDEDVMQYLYYEDSKLLKRLSFFPYLQLFIMLVFIVVVYYAVTSSKRAEQNKVWVGLSKETAHQLGTPISSLMAWVELLEAQGVDADTVAEMNKDITRLSTIASRFSKIGSQPSIDLCDLNEVIAGAANYMSSRISSKISLKVYTWHDPISVRLSKPLIEWVMENLIKNAVDAMDGQGAIDISLSVAHDEAIIEVADTGKGIPRKRQKEVFSAGYTTKTRGWGLGLTLARRIIEQYHGGRIFVYRSEPGVGTTFRITLPLASRTIPKQGQ